MPETPFRRALPPPGDVAVWWWDLDLPQAQLDAIRSTLSDGELLRADRFLRPLDAARFVVGRGRLRELLSGYTGLTPASLAFETEPRGKPRLSGESLMQAPTLRFNLSHSGAWAAAVVAAGVEVGIDVEVVRPVERDVARRFFAPEELADLEALPPSAWLDGFYRCWTRKEAVLKASGLGLEAPLTAFAVTLDKADRARLRRASGVLAGAEQWSLLPFSMTEAVPGAVAVASRQPHRITSVLPLGAAGTGSASTQRPSTA